MDERQGRRNVFAAAAAGCIGFTGFTLVMPFLPLYIAELGTTDVGEIAMWTGLTLGATPTVTAISETIPITAWFTRGARASITEVSR